MDNPPLLQASWRWRPLIVCNLVAFALLAFWIWPVGYEWVKQLDVGIFQALNGTIRHCHAWALVGAVTNLRPFDLLVALILLMLLIRSDWLYSAAQVRSALFAYIGLLLLMVVVRYLFTNLVISLGWNHDSPSIEVEGAYRLSAHFPGLEVWDLKDESKRSFPGDHASVLLLWGFFLSRFARSALQWLIVWGVTVLFMLPRLISGAHWASDDYIGGVFLSLLALAWGFYTPYAAWFSGLLIRVTRPLFALAGHLPLIKRLSVVRLP